MTSLIGKCVRCGECCTTNDQWVQTDRDTIEFCKVRGYKIIQVGKKIGQANYPMRCPHYADGCDIYKTRPRICREFPHNIDIDVCKEQGLDLNKVLPETCGFRFIDL